MVELTDLEMLIICHAGPFAGSDLGITPPPAHRLLRNTEFAGNRFYRLELRKPPKLPSWYPTDATHADETPANTHGA
jgi:hypothetical protein